MGFFYIFLPCFPHADEIGKQLADCGAKCIVTLALFLPLILQAKSSHPVLASMQVITIGEAQEGCHTFGEMLKVDSSSAKLASSSDPDLNTKEDVILLPYSSGTTGAPKGCMLTHYNLVNNLIQSNPRIDVKPFTDGNPQEVGMGLLPFFHIMAFNALGLFTFTVGGKVLCLPRFEPETYIDCLKKNKVRYPVSRIGAGFILFYKNVLLFPFIDKPNSLHSRLHKRQKTRMKIPSLTARLNIDSYL